jgi:hypothetical protein
MSLRDMFGYRVNAKPECDCAWCQASRGARFLAYLRAVSARAFVIALVFAGTFTILRGCALVVEKASRPDPCWDSTYTIEKSDSVHCRSDTLMRSHDLPDGRVEVQCWCAGHEPKEGSHGDAKN